MTVPVAISRLHFPVTTLGPGRRLGIWFQGCSIQCRGCISIDTWDKTRGITTIESIIDIMKDWIPLTDGFRQGAPKPLFTLPSAEGAVGWDPSLQKLLTAREKEGSVQTQLEVVLGWRELLENR